MNWTTTDLPQLRLWLSEARTARHEIATGTRVSVWMDQNGERVEYNRANMPTLTAYISDLETAVTTLNQGGTIASGPLQFWM
jgi:hypothetical protein